MSKYVYTWSVQSLIRFFPGLPVPEIAGVRGHRYCTIRSLSDCDYDNALVSQLSSASLASPRSIWGLNKPQHKSSNDMLMHLGLGLKEQ